MDQETIQILLVNEESEILTIISAYLRNTGFTVEIADSGEEALQHLKHIRPEIIISSNKMNFGMSGHELMKTITNYGHQDITFFLISEIDNPAERLESLRMGAYEYLVTPINLEELRLKIQHTLDLRDFRKTDEQPQNTIIMEGLLQKISLPTLLQTLAMAEMEECYIKVETPTYSGEIYISDMIVVHAELASMSGEKAFLRLLDAHEGRFQIEHMIYLGKSTMSGKLAEILLDGISKIDEYNFAKQTLDSYGTTLFMSTEEATEISELDPFSLELIELIKNNHSLTEILDQCHSSDLDIVNRLIELVKLGIVVTEI